MQDINQRFSPEYKSNASPVLQTSNASPTTNVYIKEASSKYYRSGSNSPVGFKERYVSEIKPDRYGLQTKTEERSREYFGGDVKTLNSSFETEPKSFDSQISDYRSSPDAKSFEPVSGRYDYRRDEAQNISKDKDYYRSNPEIHRRYVQDVRRYEESYHDSLRRDKHENRVNKESRFTTDRFLDPGERKDKLGDSGRFSFTFVKDGGGGFSCIFFTVIGLVISYRAGIENDFKSRDSFCYRRRHMGLDSEEDEGFASSLLIASERQHTEENINRPRYRLTDCRDDDPYRHLETMDRYRSEY